MKYEKIRKHCRLDYPGLSGKRKGECSRSEGFPLSGFLYKVIYIPLSTIMARNSIDR